MKTAALCLSLVGAAAAFAPVANKVCEMKKRHFPIAEKSFSYVPIHPVSHLKYHLPP